MATRTNIKDFYGKIMGSVEEDAQGNKIAKDFYGKILGRYDKNQNVTKDFYGKILATGDITSSLVWQAWNKREQEIKARTNK